MRTYWVLARRPAAAAQPSCSPLRQRDLWGARGLLRGGDRHLPCPCSLPGTLVWPVHACTRVGAATNGDGAPPGMRHPTHTQERSMGSEEVYRQGIELVSVARAWLRRSGACYAATALGPPATTGAMPAAAGIPAGARTSGCSGERRHESERPTSQCAVSARDLVTISVERGAPGGGPCEI